MDRNHSSVSEEKSVIGKKYHLVIFAVHWYIIAYLSPLGASNRRCCVRAILYGLMVFFKNVLRHFEIELALDRQGPLCQNYSQPD